MTVPVYLPASDSGQRAGVRRAPSMHRKTPIPKQSSASFIWRNVTASGRIYVCGVVNALGNAHSKPIGQCL